MFGLLNRQARDADDRADAIYAAIVAAARQQGLYVSYGAPDTLPGRFELVVLHAALVLRRLRREQNAAATALGQEVFDAMFRALDANLREIGVGDVTVPKRIKAMARSFYDGARTYDAALDQEDEAMLANAIGKIIFAGQPLSSDAPRRLADYAARADAALSAQSFAGLISDGPGFPPIEGA